MAAEDADASSNLGPAGGSGLGPATIDGRGSGGSGRSRTRSRSRARSRSLRDPRIFMLGGSDGSTASSGACARLSEPNTATRDVVTGQIYCRFTGASNLTAAVWEVCGVMLAMDMAIEYVAALGQRLEITFYGDNIRVMEFMLWSDGVTSAQQAGAGHLAPLLVLAARRREFLRSSGHIVVFAVPGRGRRASVVQACDAIMWRHRRGHPRRTDPVPQEFSPEISNALQQVRQSLSAECFI